MSNAYADTDDRVKVQVELSLSRALADDARLRARSLNLTLSSFLETLLVQAIAPPTRNRSGR